MRIDRTPEGGAVLALDAREVKLLGYALERATFTDTPAERQQEIFLFADDLLKSLAK